MLNSQKKIAKKFLQIVKESTKGQLRTKGLTVFVNIEDWKEELTSDSKIIVGLRYLGINIFEYHITKDYRVYIDAPIILPKCKNTNKITQYLIIVNAIIKFKTSLLNNLKKLAEELRGECYKWLDRDKTTIKILLKAEKELTDLLQTPPDFFDLVSTVKADKTVILKIVLQDKNRTEVVITSSQDCAADFHIKTDFVFKARHISVNSEIVDLLKFYHSLAMFSDKVTEILMEAKKEIEKL